MDEQLSENTRSPLLMWIAWELGDATTFVVKVGHAGYEMHS